MGHTPLISSFDYKLTSPACDPGADRWSITITFTDDISNVLPLLNATLDRAEYTHKARVLVWKGNGKKYAFRPLEISVAPLEDGDQALAYCREAVDIVNAAWARRDEIEPDYSRIELPSLMEIYKALPKNNCKECGFATCMAFAAAYRSGKAKKSDCPRFKG